MSELIERISIHSPRMGRDTDMVRAVLTGQNFNPLSPHGERLDLIRLHTIAINISIHSPRMGRDRMAHHGRCAGIAISIHSPRMGLARRNL